MDVKEQIQVVDVKEAKDVKGVKDGRAGLSIAFPSLIGLVFCPKRALASL
jgi:hypothetical protein